MKPRNPIARVSSRMKTKVVQDKREKRENCPTCGARVHSIFDHVDRDMFCTEEDEYE